MLISLPHGATHCILQGLIWVIRLQLINITLLALEHSDLKTTQGYLMTTQDEVVREMQGW